MVRGSELSEGEAQEAARAFSLFDLPGDYFEAPHVWHKLLRDHDPLHQNADGSILITRYEDIRTLWRDQSASVDKTEMFREKFGEGPLFEHHTTAMLFRDPPDHDRLREVAEPLFVPREIEAYRPDVEAVVADLLDEVAEMGGFDLVADLASRIPIQFIMRILGLPTEDGAYLRQLGLKVLFPLNPKVGSEHIEAGNEASAEFVAYANEHIARFRKAGGEAPDCVLKAVVAAGDQGRISDKEIAHMCLLTLNGGHETTTNLISVGANALMDHPDQFADLAENGEEISSWAVEECSRFVSPLQLQGRRTTKDLDLPSGLVREGTEVIICQASANRDDRKFEDPDRLRLRRRPNPHIAFGLGVHLCIGRALARIEGEITLRRIAERLPDLARTAPGEWNPNVRFRGLRSLPVSR